MIQLKDISVTFGLGTPLAHTVFHSFNLQIHNKEFVTVIGGNGAGKSTLMNVISGDVRVQKGHIFLDEKDITKLLPFERAGQISRVFQDPLLGSFASLTLEENLSLAYSRGQKRGFSSALNPSIKDKCRMYLESIHLGLENRMQDKMGLLSGGQRQAVSLIMATLQPAKILLLDEHTAALDPKMEKLVLELTHRLIADNQLTALMITHCLNQALEYGDRTLVIHQGKLVLDLNKEQKAHFKTSELLPYF